jgi:hypothetical protein
LSRYVLDDQATLSANITDDVKLVTVEAHKPPQKPAVDQEFLTLLTIISSIIGLVIIV